MNDSLSLRQLATRLSRTSLSLRQLASLSLRQLARRGQGPTLCLKDSYRRPFLDPTLCLKDSYYRTYHVSDDHGQGDEHPDQTDVGGSSEVGLEDLEHEEIQAI